MLALNTPIFTITGSFAALYRATAMRETWQVPSRVVQLRAHCRLTAAAPLAFLATGHPNTLLQLAQAHGVSAILLFR